MSEVKEQFVDLLYPMSTFYEEARQPFPSFREITGEEMPEPYRSLLVHDNDMTPTLEKYWQMKIHLRLISKKLIENVLYRQVVLEANGENIPVEYGAIRIMLDLFSEESQQVILEGYRPLGTILADYKIEHSSHPAAYFSVKSENTIGHALGVETPSILYGRCNVLVNSEGQKLAEVIEVLPSAQPEDYKES